MIDWEYIKQNPDKYEVRVGYYGGVAISSEQIKAIRFKLEMEQHFKDEQDKHDLLMHALKLGLIPD